MEGQTVADDQRCWGLQTAAVGSRGKHVGLGVGFRLEGFDEDDEQMQNRYDSYDTIRYDTRCYFNARSKADTSRLNLPHETDN